MEDKPLVAVTQLCARQDVEQNLRTAEALVQEAARGGAALVVLPENFAFIQSLRGKLTLAEPLTPAAPGPILGFGIATARAAGVHLLLGGVPILGPDPGHFYNTAILVNPSGNVVASYRKIHLFDINIPGGAVFTESELVSPGDALITAELLGTTLGLSICYDLRFPELYRGLTRLGAEVLAVPAAFTLHTGKDHWLPLLRARAIENLCYVVAANQRGAHTESRASYGKSCIVDPWGAVIAQVPDQDGVALARLDLGYLRRLRRELPALAHRRLG